MKKLIITAHHKNDAAITLFKKYFFPIQVGAELNTYRFEITPDNLGDNISFKNKSYCELTAHYYVLKNLDFDYAGLMHYRRIFTTRNNSFTLIKNHFKYYLNKLKGFVEIKDLNLFLENNFVTSDLSELDTHCRSIQSYINKIEFDGIDIILPKKIKYAYLNLKNQYSLNHYNSHFETFNRVVLLMFPQFQKILNKVNSSKKIYPYNMFVMKSSYYREYHEMLFKVLHELEKNIEMSNLDTYQFRVYGFLSERFLNYYIEWVRTREKIKIVELRTVFITSDLC
jgi:hypothetical protein